MANLDDNWKFRLMTTGNLNIDFVQERLRARRKDILSTTGNFDHSWDRPAKEQGSNNWSEALA